VPVEGSHFAVQVSNICCSIVSKAKSFSVAVTNPLGHYITTKRLMIQAPWLRVCDKKIHKPIAQPRSFPLIVVLLEYKRPTLPNFLNIRDGQARRQSIHTWALQEM